MGNFIHEDLVEELGLVCIPQRPLPLMDVKGLKIGSLDFQVQIEVGIGSHEEHLVLDVAPIGSHRIILGLPWLEAHDPMITWSNGHIQFTSPHCNTHCLPQPHDVFAKTTNVSINSSDIGIPVIRRSPEAQLPTRGSKESASWDLYSIEESIIQPGHRALVNTGISI